LIVEIGSEARRRRISRRSLWLVLAGFLVILFDIAIINWTLTVPQGALIWTAIFTLGVVLIVSSSDLARITPQTLSEVRADQVEKWEKSGDLVTMVDNLSQDEASTLLGFSRKHFGEYVAEAGTTSKGRTWTVKLWRVGSQILPARLEEGRPLFKVILYRRDLASQKGIRRPWRAIYREDSTLKRVKPGPLIELPSWIAD
jgi:hypothetical protein